MAIVASDIKYKYSVAAAAGNTTAGTAATSLGDQVSTTEIPAATLNALFDDVSGAESSAGDVEYRGIFVHNTHATLTYQNATVEVTGQTAGGGTLDVATDNIAASAVGSGTAQMGTIANESTAPSAASAFATGPISLGNIPPLSVKGVWVRRTVSAGAGAVDPDAATIRCNGDTLP